MVFEFKLPDIGEGVHEGEIVQWVVAEGDEVGEDEDIVEVMTDKATVMISSPKAGTVETLHFQEGDTVDVGQTIITIAVSDGDATGASSADAEDAGQREGEASPADRRPAAAGATDAAAAASHAPTAARTPAGVLAPPSVRIAARKQGIDLTNVEGSGRGGRVQMADLASAVEQDQAAQASDPQATPSPRPGAQAPSGLSFWSKAPSVDRTEARGIEPLAPAPGSPRASSARAKALQAHFSYTLPVDADRLREAADQLLGDGQAADPEASLQALVLKAIAQGLAKHPRCNALVDEATGDLVIPGHVHVALSKAGPDGLVTQQIPDAQALSLGELVARIQTPVPEEAGQATVRVTALGELGGVAAMPVLDHPRVTAVHVGGVHEVARLEGDRVVVGHELTLSFSFDHRYVDGYDGAVFAQEVAGLLETPNTLLLDAR